MFSGVKIYKIYLISFLKLNEKVTNYICITFFPNLSLADDFKSIKKATVTNPKIIFPIQTKKGECSEPAYHAFVQKIDPIEKLDAPTGYGLDDRFDQVEASLSNTVFLAVVVMFNHVK